MFRCQVCQCVAPPRTPPRRLIERRPKQYPHRARAHVVVVRQVGKRKRKEYRDDPGGAGQETARELLACPECAAKYDARIDPPSARKED